MGQGLAEQGRVKGEEERVVVDYHYQLLLGCLSACSLLCCLTLLPCSAA